MNLKTKGIAFKEKIGSVPISIMQYKKGKELLYGYPLKSTADLLKLLKKKPVLNVRDGYKGTVLMYAAKKNDVTMLRALLKMAKLRNQNILDDKDRNGMTALLWAVYEGNMEAVTFLLNRNNKANLEAKDSYGRTALIVAVQNQNTPMVRLLLNHDADLNAQDDQKDSAFYQAVASGRRDLIDPFLHRLPDVNKRNFYGLTPLACAVMLKDKETVLAMMKMNPDLDIKNALGESVMDLAKRHSNQEIVDILKAQFPRRE